MGRLFQIVSVAVFAIVCMGMGLAGGYVAWGENNAKYPEGIYVCDGVKDEEQLYDAYSYILTNGGSSVILAEEGLEISGTLRLPGAILEYKPWGFIMRLDNE